MSPNPSNGEGLWFPFPVLIATDLFRNSWFHSCMMMLTIVLTVDYILKDPTERERLNVHETPRVYPQWLVMLCPVFWLTHNDDDTVIRRCVVTFSLLRVNSFNIASVWQRCKLLGVTGWLSASTQCQRLSFDCYMFNIYMDVYMDSAKWYATAYW